MKTASLKFIAAFVISFLFFSCENDALESDYFSDDYRVRDVLYKKDSKLKRVYNVYINNDSNSKTLHAEYQYDNLGRISRINYGTEIYAYDLYQYNAKGELNKTAAYSVNSTNQPVLTRIVDYLYDDQGNKVKEQTTYTDGWETIYDLFHYSGKKLTKQEYYKGTQQQYYIVYKYEGDNLVKEKLYSPGGKDFVTTKHFYDQNLLVYSVTNEEKDWPTFHDTKYYYDRNDNLIRTVSNVPGLSSTWNATEFYVIRENEYE